MQLITNPSITDDNHHQSFNIDERISNIAFICDNNESIKSTPVTKLINNEQQFHQKSTNETTLEQSQNKTLQRNRRHSIIMNTKRRKSMKIGRSLRDQARAKAKRDRNNIYNTCRMKLNKKSSSSSNDDDNDCESNCNHQLIIENNNNNDRYLSCDLKMFENLLQTKHCDMPYNNAETPTLSNKYSSLSIDCANNNNSSKTIYPNTSGNRKIPYLRYSSKSLSRQTIFGTTTLSSSDAIMIADDNIINDRPRIRLIDLCSWQQLDRSIQSIVLFFVCCFIVNCYQIIWMRID